MAKTSTTKFLLKKKTHNQILIFGGILAFHRCEVNFLYSLHPKM
jgi:hypothetical protein